MDGCIVVVEDEPDLLGMLSDVLELEGFSVVSVSHPAQLEARMDGVRPDLFLIDVMLPAVSGVEVADRLRHNGYGDTPMIAMSASRLMTAVASESGMFQVALDKPFELDNLFDCIERSINGR